MWVEGKPTDTMRANRNTKKQKSKNKTKNKRESMAEGQLKTYKTPSEEKEKYGTTRSVRCKRENKNAPWKTLGG